MRTDVTYALATGDTVELGFDSDLGLYLSLGLEHHHVGIFPLQGKSGILSGSQLLERMVAGKAPRYFH